MEVWGWIILIVGAFLIGLVAQFLPQARSYYDWLIVGVAAGIGGFIGSELLGGLSAWGPEYQGLYLLPALIGAVILAVIADSVERYVYHPTTV
jgi:uncharacterized membrane protein YeaQ/YmgE (transglycosylase-associated protein family)